MRLTSPRHVRGKPRTSNCQQHKHEVDQLRKLSGRPWFKGTSGNPSGRKQSKRYPELRADIVLDLALPSALAIVVSL